MKIIFLISSCQTGCFSFFSNASSDLADIWSTFWTFIFLLKRDFYGVPTVAHWDQRHLGSTGTQVQSLAWHSGLRIRRCRSCGLVCSCSLDLITGPGTPYAEGSLKRKKKKKRERERFLEVELCVQRYKHFKDLLFLCLWTHGFPERLHHFIFNSATNESNYLTFKYY